MKKHFVVIVFLIAVIVPAHAMWENVKRQPYWHLQKIVQEGNEVVFTTPVGFSLYYDNELHIQLAVNDWCSTLQTQDDKTIAFVKQKIVPIDNRPQNDKLLAEEKLVKDLFFQVNIAKMVGENLLLENQKVQFTFTPGEYPGIKALQEKTWLFEGFIPTVSYGPPPQSQNEPIKLWGLHELKILLTCGKPTYEQKTNILHYPVSGTINNTPYTATITINKNRNESRMHIDKIKVDGIWLQFTKAQKQIYRQKNSFVDALKKVDKIGYLGNKLCLYATDGGHLIFQNSGQ